MSETHHIAATVHGRYLVDRPAGEGPFPVLAGFHGYGESAARMLAVLRRLRQDRSWLLVSVQALHPFYTRGGEVVANWMTSEDRELAIADNIAYVGAALAQVWRDHPVSSTLVYAGFSQGVAMAYRAAAFAAAHAAIPPPAAAILLAGDVPPDVAPVAHRLPRILLGRGATDQWYTREKADADLQVLAGAGVTPLVHVFDGGHEWDDTFVEAARAWLDEVAAAAR